MSHRHPDAEALRRYDEADPGERHEIVRHAAACAACRSHLLAEDPCRQFGLLALAPVPEEALERLTARLDADLDGASGGGWRRSVAPIAASLLLACGLGGYLLRTSSPRSAPVTLDRGELEAVLERRVPAEGVQLISSPGTADVLDLTVGDTQIVMIFDEALDI